jgi:hypothetical protein
MSMLRESFVRDGPMWRATRPVGTATLPIVIFAGKKGPDDALLSLIEDVIPDAERLEEEARAFIRIRAREHASKGLRLSGLHFLYPASGWKPDGVSVALNAPIFGLQFAIGGDLNVLDVNFVSGHPIEADYH